MTDGFLDDRRRALEDSFFAARNEELLAALKKKVKNEAQLNLLAEASGIIETRVLGKISDVDIRAETITALSLVPLVEVAWANGFVEDKEIAAVMKAAEKSGIVPDSPSHKLLKDWLKHKPEPAMYEAWKDYVQALHRKMTPEAFGHLKTDIMHRAHDVAASTGGFLGIGSVSKSEQKKLAELEAVFEGQS